MIFDNEKFFLDVQSLIRNLYIMSGGKKQLIAFTQKSPAVEKVFDPFVKTVSSIIFIHGFLVCFVFKKVKLSKIFPGNISFLFFFVLFFGGAGDGDPLVEWL